MKRSDPIIQPTLGGGVSARGGAMKQSFFPFAFSLQDREGVGNPKKSKVDVCFLFGLIAHSCCFCAERGQ